MWDVGLYIGPCSNQCEKSAFTSHHGPFHFSLKPYYFLLVTTATATIFFVSLHHLPSSLSLLLLFSSCRSYGRRLSSACNPWHHTSTNRKPPLLPDASRVVLNLVGQRLKTIHRPLLREPLKNNIVATSTPIRVPRLTDHHIVVLGTYFFFALCCWSVNVLF